MDTMNPLTQVNIYHETANGFRGISIGDELYRNRTLCITGPIDSNLALQTCELISLLDREDGDEPITLHISSPGGSVSAGLAIIDAMKMARHPVRTVCLETAASMAAAIFIMGDERLMLHHSELMIHDPLIAENPGGSALEFQRRSQRLLECREMMAGLMAERSGLSIEKVYELTRQDTYLDVDSAVELGFADGEFGSERG